MRRGRFGTGRRPCGVMAARNYFLAAKTRHPYRRMLLLLMMMMLLRATMAVGIRGR